MSRATLLEEPSHSSRDRHGCYSSAKTWAQHRAKHTRGAPVHLPAGMEKQPQEPGTLSQDKARGERLHQEELDVLHLPRFPWRAALRLGRNTSTSSSSPQAALPFFKQLGNCLKKSKRGKTHSSETASLPGTGLRHHPALLLTPCLKSTLKIKHSHYFRQYSKQAEKQCLLFTKDKMYLWISNSPFQTFCFSCASLPRGGDEEMLGRVVVQDSLSVHEPAVHSQHSTCAPERSPQAHDTAPSSSRPS